MIAGEAGHVHLTFDDGPDPLWTPGVLNALSRARAQATFFVMTTKVVRHPHLVDAILRSGHAIGLHCHEHLRHTRMTRAEIEADTDTALGVLAGHGLHPTLWRVPWGVEGEATAAVAAARGLRLVHWTTDTEDWRGGDAGAMLAKISPDLRDGAIVLAHDGIGPGALRHGCGQTVAFVEPLVLRAERRGLACTPVPEAVPV